MPSFARRRRCPSQSERLEYFENGLSDDHQILHYYLGQSTSQRRRICRHFLLPVGRNMQLNTAKIAQKAHSIARICKRNANAIVDVRIRCLGRHEMIFWNISETIRANDFKIYSNVAPDSLYPSTGNDVTIYFGDSRSNHSQDIRAADFIMDGRRRMMDPVVMGLTRSPPIRWTRKRRA